MKKIKKKNEEGEQKRMNIEKNYKTTELNERLSSETRINEYKK